MRKMEGAVALILLLFLTACGSGPASGETSVMGESTGSAAPQKEGGFTVGVVQLVQHPALDAATKGFQEELQKEFGDQVKIDVQNASGEIANVATIVNGFVAQGVDLILANATPPLQAAAAATNEIPVLGTAVTDYGVALELEGFEAGKGTGRNISGTSDLSPFDQQAELFSEWFPDAKTVGIIYSSSEANSVFQVEEMTRRLATKGYTVKPYSFTDSNDLPAVLQQAVAASDVLYEPTDNTASSNAEAIANIVLPAKKPVITADAAPAAAFGVAALSIDYEALGTATGQMAGQILRGDKKVDEMPIQYAPSVTKMVNAQIAKDLGLTIPEGYQVIPGTEVK